jgi:ArsR family transcriptional regulator
MQPSVFFKCLADDTRLRLLFLLLGQKELCVCDLHEALDISQPKASRHLADLRKCGLVLDERKGRWMYYRLHPELPAWAREVILLTKVANADYITGCEVRLTQFRLCEDDK